MNQNVHLSSEQQKTDGKTSHPEHMIVSDAIEPFAQRVASEGQGLQRMSPPTTLQVNIGKLCNLACHHCHVEAGPTRTENMTRDVLAQLLELLAKSPSIHTVDITGGAPELNPHFRWFVSALRVRGYHVIDRCNLTVLFEPDQHDTAAFLAEHNVEVVASLPCYSELNVDKQRGKGSFSKSIQGLRLLNDLGYGRDSAKRLNLVYNPIGAHLPPPQASLENDYRDRLKHDFDIEFNTLLTITNIVIKRFEHQLQRDGQLADYQQLLVDSFNPQAAANIMCRDIVSVSWEGKLYDCDFNQMLELPVASRQTVFDIDNFEQLADAPIQTRNHCYACTAGAGSSCSGALV